MELSTKARAGNSSEVRSVGTAVGSDRAPDTACLHAAWKVGQGGAKCAHCHRMQTRMKVCWALGNDS